MTSDSRGDSGVRTESPLIIQISRRFGACLELLGAKMFAWNVER